jgi:predicted AAA+ superfamily ATPase
MRYITPFVLEDLKKKMVFVGGPRQVGKTTLAKAVLSAAFPAGRYLNWEKRWIKGIYDVLHEKHSFLVTGSARLDVYRRGGDSLMGRYHYWRLHPFTLDEIPKGISPKEAFHRLMTVGGFPEPFLDADERSARRWRRERFDRVLREDVRDLESIRNIQLLGMYLDLLRHRVGGLITLSNIANSVFAHTRSPCPGRC